MEPAGYNENQHHLQVIIMKAVFITISFLTHLMIILISWLIWGYIGSSTTHCLAFCHTKVILAFSLLGNTLINQNTTFRRGSVFLTHPVPVSVCLPVLLSQILVSEIIWQCLVSEIIWMPNVQPCTTNTKRKTTEDKVSTEQFRFGLLEAFSLSINCRVQLEQFPFSIV